MKSFRIAMVQMNPIVGDLDGNARAICRGLAKARRVHADVVVFPELAITGYPPEDLLMKPRFIRDAARAMKKVVREAKGLVAIVGCVASRQGGRITAVGDAHDQPQTLYNAAAMVADTRMVGVYAKRHLPNYGVFDERRYFHTGKTVPVLRVNGTTIGVNICEDIWQATGPTRTQALVGGAEVIVNINASPFQMGKCERREQMLANRARNCHVIVSYTNMVGGQDELVFDGNSMILDHTGAVIHRGQSFHEDFLVNDLPVEQLRAARRSRRRRAAKTGKTTERLAVSVPSRAFKTRLKPAPVPSPLCQEEEVYRALVLGVRDYVTKNRFHKVVIGISGGIDSALTAMIARDALDAGQVLGVLMPSPYTSRASRDDARELARDTGIELLTIPISRLFRAYLRLLEQRFRGHPVDTTEENLQARIRGNILMALSNKFGHLVLTTGNKSEMSVGYATLYGDMAGGFAVIKDVPKTLVFDVARWRNAYRGAMFAPARIPQRIIDRPPSAELKPDQVDQDTLPPYPTLDAILKAYIEDDCAPDDIAAMGFPLAVVNRVIAMVDASEYKRRQAPIGIKITPRALGKDRRMPMTNRYPH